MIFQKKKRNYTKNQYLNTEIFNLYKVYCCERYLDYMVHQPM